MIQLLTILLCAGFWRLGGWKGSLKPFRAVGVPIALVYGKTLVNGYSPWIFLYVLTLWGMMSLFSYGKDAPPHLFWVSIFKKGKEGDVWLVEFLTRMTVGFFWSLSACVFFFVGASWRYFILYAVGLTLLNGFIGASRTLSALQSELLVGASVALCVLI